MNQFSKDPKIKTISLKNFLEKNNYLINKFKKWNGYWEGIEFHYYYNFTSEYLMLIKYTYTGTLEKIELAKRDGKTEYELFNERYAYLKSLRQVKSRKEEIEKLGKRIRSLNRIFPKFNVNINNNSNKTFTDYLIQTNVKTEQDYAKQFVVFDVETNGLRTDKDDLLSLSIYDPYTGNAYNRFFPLDLQPIVSTTHINGITEEDLKGNNHITQEEINELIDYFDLTNRTLLSYSGGKGDFDINFVNNYSHRHNSNGFENLKLDNIRKFVPKSSFETYGYLTKDNLCTILGIEGVKELHSSLNDCILEWKLYEKIKNMKLFLIGNQMYNYDSNYIIPVSYLSNMDLVKIAEISLPDINGKATLVYSYSFPKKELMNIKKFDTNITGISIENAIDSLLNVEEQEYMDFQINNKKHLQFIGNFCSKYDEMPIILNGDGTISSLDEKYDKEIDEVNNVTKIISDNISPLIDYIKNTIFNNEKIINQEIVINKDNKIYARCDLSSKNSVLEIKTSSEINQNGEISDKLARQLYYQSNNRNLFTLQIEFEIQRKRYEEDFIKSLNFNIYKINIKENKH